MKNRKLSVGDPIVFVNEYGVIVPALVTALWCQPTRAGLTLDPFYATEETKTWGERVVSCGQKPTLNLLIVTVDASKHDSCGRQSEHKTSIVHMDNNSAHGMYWRLPEEEGKPSERDR
jgi:hypothetical protein